MSDSTKRRGYHLPHPAGASPAQLVWKVAHSSCGAVTTAILVLSRSKPRATNTGGNMELWSGPSKCHRPFLS